MRFRSKKKIRVISSTGEITTVPNDFRHRAMIRDGSLRIVPYTIKKKPKTKTEKKHKSGGDK